MIGAFLYSNLVSMLSTSFINEKYASREHQVEGAE
jgi:hypothetical protein